MKRIISTCLGLIVLCSMVWVGNAQALQTRSGERVEVAKGEVVNSTAYLAGSKVTIEGTIKGDLFCAGQEITITGTIEGDVLCAAQNVRVNGTVQGDLRIASQFALISGKIDGSASIVSQSATFEDKAIVAKDVTLFGQTLTLAGVIGRDALVGGETISVSSKITRDVKFMGEDIVLRGAHIGGDLVYVSRAQAKLEQHTTIAGKTEHQDPPVHNKQRQPMGEMLVSGALFWLGSFGLIGVLSLAFASAFMERMATRAKQKPFFTLGMGLLVLTVTPVLALFSLITIIGMPIAFILTALWLSALLVSIPLASYSFGSILTQKLGWKMRGLPFVALFLGLLLVILLALIPFVGGLVIFLTMLWGLGALALSCQNTHQLAKVSKKPPAQKA